MWGEITHYSPLHLENIKTTITQLILYLLPWMLSCSYLDIGGLLYLENPLLMSDLHNAPLDIQLPQCTPRHNAPLEASMVTGEFFSGVLPVQHKVSVTVTMSPVTQSHCFLPEQSTNNVFMLLLMQGY